MVFKGGEELARLLTIRGIASRASVWRSVKCDMVVFESEGELYALTYGEASGGWAFVKIYPAGASVSLRSCEEFLYSPWGLYVYGRSIEEIIEGIREKIPRLAAMGRVSASRV